MRVDIRKILDRAAKESRPITILYGEYSCKLILNRYSFGPAPGSGVPVKMWDISIEGYSEAIIEESEVERLRREVAELTEQCEAMADQLERLGE